LQIRVKKFGLPGYPGKPISKNEKRPAVCKQQAFDLFIQQYKAQMFTFCLLQSATKN
jgi:hypothetical protein